MQEDEVIKKDAGECRRMQEDNKKDAGEQDLQGG